MNCEECKNLIGVFLESDLEATLAADVRTHLAICGDCTCACEDIASMIDIVADGPKDIVPPNSQALWCRINNIIESEMKPPAMPPEPEPQRGRFWRLSFGQLTAAVLGVAIFSSLVTVVALRSIPAPGSDGFATASKAEMTVFEKILGRLGLAETRQQIRERRMRQQQAAIEYWDARVQSRRAQWDHATREAFDRNLHVIDQSVSEYSMILQHNPDDDLSGEMLDSVLDDKMNLLRDFADL